MKETKLLKKNMTKQEILTNWKNLKSALESGEYQKGKYGLKTENAPGDYEYCCLGVATELVYEKVDVRFEKDKNASFMAFTDENKKICGASLIKNVAKQYGLGIPCLNHLFYDLFEKDFSYYVKLNYALTILNDSYDDWDPIIKEINEIISHIESKQF